MQLKQGLESVNRHRFLKFRWQFIPQYECLSSLPCFLGDHSLTAEHTDTDLSD